MKRRIAVLGGSFDPPRNGHIEVIKSLLEVKDLIDEVWISPTGVRKSKKTVASPLQRFAMIELAINVSFDSKSLVKILDVRTASKNSYPTIVLLENLESWYPQDDFYLAVGSDNAQEIENCWYRGRELVQTKKIIVIPRTETELVDNLPTNFIVLDKQFSVGGSSSTEMRQKIKTGEDISHLVPHIIMAYIQRYGLYRSRYPSAEIQNKGE